MPLSEGQGVSFKKRGERNEKASGVWPSEALKIVYIVELQTISAKHSAGDKGSTHAGHKHSLANDRQMLWHAGQCLAKAGG